MQARLGCVLTFIFIFILIWIIPGCAGSEVARSSQGSGTIVNRSATAALTHDQARLDRCADQIVPAAMRARISVSTLNREDPGAFAWRDGRIFVTSALVQRLDDDEICAAIAHELGHLTAAERPTERVNLLVAHGDIEPAADRAGLGFLRNASIDPSAMVRLLTKLEASPGLSASLRQGIQGRIHIITSKLRK